GAGCCVWLLIAVEPARSEVAACPTRRLFRSGGDRPGSPAAHLARPARAVGLTPSAAGPSPVGSARRSCRADRGRRISVRVAVHRDRKSTRLNSSHVKISYAVFCLKKKQDRRA